MIIIKTLLLIGTTCSIFFLAGCASVPSEFLTTMEAERNGILVLQKRHQQTVTELVDNWYNERLERMISLKQTELSKVTVSLPDPESGEMIDFIDKESLLRIEKQFDEAIIGVNNIRSGLVDGYLDTENWEKLVKINEVNLDMTKSLLELNEAQRNFYSEIVGKSVPYPTDFLNSKTKELLEKTEFK